MTDVEARLSSMYEAAQQLELSRERIGQSMATVRELIDGLMALGYQSPAALALWARYLRQVGEMENSADKLSQFAVKLNNAAQAFEEALQAKGSTAPLPVISSPVFPKRKKPVELFPTLNDPAAAVPTAPAEPLDAYLSTHNREVYGELNGKRKDLQNEYGHLDTLMASRASAANDLDALENRIVSFDKHANVSANPRVQALKAQIASLDAQISQTHQHINTLSDDIHSLTVRLDLVKPGAGADLKLIASMEGGQTKPWIVSHTYDCVHYITQRMNIPDGLPVDAYQWVDMLKRMPQYGMTTGQTPLVGAVLVMSRSHPYANHTFGHLMYVERVDHGQVWITDNNHSTPVLLSSLTPDTSGADVTYIYFPWQTQA